MNNLGINCDEHFKFLEQSVPDSRMQDILCRARSLIATDPKAEKTFEKYLRVSMDAWLDTHGFESIEKVGDYSGVLGSDWWREKDIHSGFIFSKIKDAVSIHNLLASCISDAKKPRKILDVCGGCGNIAFTLGLLNESETIDCVEIVDRWKNFDLQRYKGILNYFLVKQKLDIFTNLHYQTSCLATLPPGFFEGSRYDEIFEACCQRFCFHNVDANVFMAKMVDAYDLIIAISAIDFLDVDNFFARAATSCVPGGKLLVSWGNRLCYTSGASFLPGILPWSHAILKKDVYLESIRHLNPVVYDFCRKLVDTDGSLFHDRASIIASAKKNGFRQVNISWSATSVPPDENCETMDSYFAKYLNWFSKNLGYKSQDNIASLFLDLVNVNYPSASMQDLMGHQCVVVFEKVDSST